MKKVEKKPEDNFGLFEKEVFRNIIITAVSSVPIFYIFGALLLWEYLDRQNLRGEFPLLVGSNNLLLSIALLGIVATLIILFHLLSPKYLIKHFIKTNNIVVNKKIFYDFLILFAPISILFAAIMIDINELFLLILSLIVFSVFGYIYWRNLKKSPIKNKYNKENKYNLLTCIFLVFLLATYNLIPLLIIISVVEKFVKHDLYSSLLLGLFFAIYSLLIACSIELKNKKSSMKLIVIIIISLFVIAVKFSYLPLNTAKMLGLGHACIDITLKKEAVSEQFLKKLTIISPNSPLKLVDVYVLLHKNTKEYIVSSRDKSTKLRIPYSYIENEGFLQDCSIKLDVEI